MSVAIETIPFHHSSPALLGDALAGCPERALKDFIRSWADLPVDAYLPDGATFRQRRYGRFRLANDQLAPTDSAVFEQSAEVNTLFGGVERRFEPLADAVASSEVLRRIVLAFLDNLPGENDRTATGVGVHQIRIVAGRDESSMPAPEGIHEDGHHFVAQVLINREDVAGGESRLYDRDKQPIFRTTLLQPFESIVIDDRRVFHGVSAITPADGAERGVRDMMLIDFFPLTD